MFQPCTELVSRGKKNSILDGDLETLLKCQIKSPLLKKVLTRF